MGLSNKEIDLLIKKLREKFKESAAEYRTRLFNIEAFEERLQMALRKRMNMEGFILSEIANYEKIKQRLEEERNPKPSEESAFSKKVNRILEENTAKIKKYPSILFHPEAGLEITHFYGALTEFTLNYFSIMPVLIDDPALKKIYRNLENLLYYFAVPKNKNHPRRIEDHISILERRTCTELEIERDKNDYLKEGAFLLHEIGDFTENLIEMRNRDWENPIKFDKLFPVSGESRNRMTAIFKNMTPYGAIIKVKEQAENIISDFRLESFRRKVAVR